MLKGVLMPNVTLAIDDKLLRDGRKYAQNNGVTLNALIRSLLVATVSPESNRLDEMFERADSLEITSQGETWNREDLYRV